MHRTLLSIPLLLLPATVIAQGNPTTGAVNADSTVTLRTRIERLEALVAQLNRPQPAAKNDSLGLGRGANGFTLVSRDGEYQLRLHGVIQSDARVVSGDLAPQAATTFLMRRVRPAVEAQVGRLLDFRIVPDFGQGVVSVFDAHVDLRFRKALSLRTGKFKPPIGLERLQSAADLLFVERGMPTNLIPQRDIGMQLYGEFNSGVLSYAVGGFNGAFDLGTADSDNDNRKDVSARIFAMPFLKRGPTWLSGLGVGVGSSQGIQRGTTASPGLGTYRSPAQQPVFSYRSDGTGAGTTIASGKRTRIAPQAYLYSGKLGLMAEYTTSSQAVTLGTNATTLTHRAWQTVAHYVLVGGKASYRSVTPTHLYGRAQGGWGALELAARTGGLKVDPATFPTYANTASAVSDAREVAVGFNWHLAPGVKIVTDFELTRFTNGAATGNRPNERAVLLRVQHAF